MCGSDPPHKGTFDKVTGTQESIFQTSGTYQEGNGRLARQSFMYQAGKSATATFVEFVIKDPTVTTSKHPSNPIFQGGRRS